MTIYLWLAPILSVLWVIFAYFFILKKDEDIAVEDPYKTKKPEVVLEYEDISDYSEMATDYDLTITLKDLLKFNKGLSPVENMDFIDITNLKILTYETN